MVTLDRIIVDGLQRVHLGADSEDALVTMSWLALALEREGKHAAAEKVYRSRLL